MSPFLRAQQSPQGRWGRTTLRPTGSQMCICEGTVFDGWVQEGTVIKLVQVVTELRQVLLIK